MKQIFQLGSEAFLFLLLLFSSCTQDLVQPSGGDCETVPVRLSIVTAPMQTAGEPSATRSDATRTEAEKVLKSLWILQFNGTAAGSTLIKKEDIAAHVQNGFVEVTLLANNAKNRVYLLANADASAFTENATTVQAFEAGILSFAPCTEAELIAKGLPMIASADINPRTDNPGTLVLHSLVTRLTLQCKVASDFACDIQSVTLNQVSEKVSVAPMTAGDAASRPAAVVAADFTKSLEISGADKTATMVCYFPENLAGRKTGLTEMWERTTANAPAEKAAYLKIVGTTPTGKSSFYTFYLGDGSVTDFNVERNRNYKLSLTLESADDTDLRVESYVDLNPDGCTANCYLAYISNEIYGFDATKPGNDSNVSGITKPTNLTTAVEARVLWQTDGTTSVVKDVKLQNGKVIFTTGTATEGNAVIGIFASNASNAPCLWSWHIWRLPSAPGTKTFNKTSATTGGTVAVTMMDRNLGAYNNTANDVKAIGLLYQWGRKDPFPGPADFYVPEPGNIYGSLYAGGAVKTFNGAYTIPAVKSDATTGTINYGIQYPGAFIYQGPNDDWLQTKDDNLWGTPWLDGGTGSYNKNQGTKSIYDPCPPGYRVPPQDTWNLQTVDGSWNNGMTMDKLGSFWVPASGFRWGDSSAGRLAYGGVIGNYWSSSPYDASDVNAGYLSFYGGGINPRSNNYRANGSSVRCVSE